MINNAVTQFNNSSMEALTNKGSTTGFVSEVSTQQQKLHSCVTGNAIDMKTTTNGKCDSISYNIKVY